MPRHNFGQEVKDFVEAFKGGNELAYKWQWMKYLQEQQRLNQKLQKQQFDSNKFIQEQLKNSPFTKGTPGSDNTTTPQNQQTAGQTTPPAKVTPAATTPEQQPVKAQKPEAEPAETTPQPKSGGGDKQASILDRYPGSYQEASLTSDLPPVRPNAALQGVSAPQGGATPRGQNSVGSWWTPERMRYAANYMQQNAGLSKMGAAGLVARWAGVEAPEGPTAINKDSKAFGIAQWLGDRKGAIKGNTNFDDQLAHAAKELNTTEGAAAKALRSASTPAEGARGASMFERAENYNGNTGLDDHTHRTPVSKVYDAIYGEGSVPAATTPSSRDAGSPSIPPSDARNTRQRTAADASSMSDANNDIRRTGGAAPQQAVPAATTPSNTTPAAATTSQAQPPAPPGTHYTQYGPNSILIDDKTGAPVANLKGWEHASDAAKSVNGDTQQAVPADKAPEFPKTAGQEPPDVNSMRRPDDLTPKAPEAAQPAADQSGQTAQGDSSGGWNFDDLNIPADFDIGKAFDGVGDAIGDAMGGVGDALGGIGDAIGGALSAFNRGGMVRRYEFGGPVEGDDAESALPMDASYGEDTSSMPTSALPFGGGQEDEAAGGGDDIFSGAAEAVKAGLQGLQDMFGLGGAAALPGANGTNPQAAKALLSGQGALSQQDMQSIKSTVDPNNQLGEGMANIAALDALYKTYLMRGETGKARQIAAGIIQFAHNRSTALGNIALAALEKGDTTPAAKALVQAFNVIPNAQRVSIVNGSAVVQDMKSGKTIREIKLTPEVMINAARQIAGGSESYSELMNFASGKNGAPQSDPAYDKYVQSRVDQEANNRPPALETTPAAQPASAEGGEEGGEPKQALNIDPARDKNSAYYVPPPQLPAEPQKPFVANMDAAHQKTVLNDWYKEHTVWHQNTTALTQQYNSAVKAANDKAKQDTLSGQKDAAAKTKQSQADRKEAVKGINDAWDERDAANKTPAPPQVAAAVKSTARVIMKDNDLDQYDGLDYADQLVNPNSKIELKEKKGGGGSATMEDGTTLDLSPKAYGHVKRLRDRTPKPEAAVDDKRPSWTNEIKEGVKGGLRGIADTTLKNLSGRPVSSIDPKLDGKTDWRGLDNVTTSSGYDKRFGTQ